MLGASRPTATQYLCRAYSAERERRCSGRGGAACGLYGRHRPQARAALARWSPQMRARWRSPCRRLQAPRCAARPAALKVGSEARVVIGQPPPPVVVAPPSTVEKLERIQTSRSSSHGLRWVTLIVPFRQWPCRCARRRRSRHPHHNCKLDGDTAARAEDSFNRLNIAAPLSCFLLDRQHQPWKRCGGCRGYCRVWGARVTLQWGRSRLWGGFPEERVHP